MTDMKWNSISDVDWEAIQAPAKKTKESPYDEIINALVDGQIVAFTVDDEKDVRGIRIGIARRASATNGVKLSFKWDNDKHLLAIRLNEEEERSQPATGEKRKPGRPRKA